MIPSQHAATAPQGFLRVTLHPSITIAAGPCLASRCCFRRVSVEQTLAVTCYPHVTLLQAAFYTPSHTMSFSSNASILSATLCFALPSNRVSEASQCKVLHCLGACKCRLRSRNAHVLLETLPGCNMQLIFIWLQICRSWIQSFGATRSRILGLSSKVMVPSPRANLDRSANSHAQWLFTVDHLGNLHEATCLQRSPHELAFH